MRQESWGLLSPKYNARQSQSWGIWDVFAFFGIPDTLANIVAYYEEMYQFARCNPQHKFYD